MVPMPLTFCFLFLCPLCHGHGHVGVPRRPPRGQNIVLLGSRNGLGSVGLAHQLFVVVQDLMGPQNVGVVEVNRLHFQYLGTAIFTTNFEKIISLKFESKTI